MEFEATKLEGVFLIKPKRFEDARGYFSETFRANIFARETGLDVNFVQDNFSYSKHRGTIRALHYQAPPLAQGKLVSCTRGQVLDAIVDVRAGSPTYGEHLTAVLSEKNGHQLWVPAGFLHGFAALSDDCHLTYKVTEYYSGSHDGAVRWNDPDLAIDWGITDLQAILSDKDKAAPLFKNWSNPFSVAGTGSNL